MNVGASTIAVYGVTKVLPAVWFFFKGLFQTRTQVIERYCPPSIELPANMTDFQKEQYNKQCGDLNVYTLMATPVKKANPEPKPMEAKP